MAMPAAHKTARSIAASLTAALMLGACAQGSDDLKTSLIEPQFEATPVKDTGPTKPQSELEKATEYWGKKFKDKPTDLEAALSYSKNLKAMGERQQAMQVIQQAAVYHGNDRQLASEYGRLALELDHVSVAKQMLAVADDPTAPDWRVISAKGTVAAKEGKVRDAIAFYERALLLSQEQTSVMNNLAMAYAMNGEADKAEDLLSRIEAKGGSTAKTRQNLALVQSLQGKFDEANKTAARDLGADGAAHDTELLKRMVRVNKPADWSTTATSARAQQAAAKAAAAAQAAAVAAANDGPDMVQPAADDTSGDAVVPSKASATPADTVLKGMAPH